ncbi:MAG TPA: tetratricopeptide repeat protein, partial [Bryobacteraceae bacterium]|nr:tetratricopeptide repeat protein [Bryobacteraceae bacterium]
PAPVLAPDAPIISPETMDQIEEVERRTAERAAELQSRLPDLDELSRRAAEQVQRRLPELEQQAREAAAQARVEERAAAAEARAAAKAQTNEFRFRFTADSGALFQQKTGAGQRRFANEDRLYDAGKRALDSHRWDDALEDFNQIASNAGPRADAALYWKAYALNKLGRRDEAVAALAELRKSYPNSNWLESAKALELEVQQAAGKPVSPDQQADEDLKLIAINSIMQSDPDRAMPLLENLLKTSTSPKLKERAIFVLAQSGSPRAHQILERIARGGANPDLQVKAIEYMRQYRRQSDNPDLLPEIYASTNDITVKRAILDAYGSYREWDHLLQAARSEKNHDLYIRAVERLGNHEGQPELWQLYQSASAPEDKVQILECMYSNANVEKLSDTVRNEKDPKVLAAAIEMLARQKANTADTLVAVYGTEQDDRIKQTIVDSLYNQRNAKAMVELARTEKDPKMKLRIVDRLGGMKSKEASDYLLELLSK